MIKPTNLPSSCANSPGLIFLARLLLRTPSTGKDRDKHIVAEMSEAGERKKAGIEPTVGQEGPARLMQLSLRDGRTLCWSPAAHHWTVLQAASTRWR